MSSAPLLESNLQSLPLIHRGKVRDLYAVGEDKLLIVQSDRLSAFDVILPTPIPGKGEVLTELSLFWFNKLDQVVANHLTGIDPLSVVSVDDREQIRGRAMVTRKLQPLMVEAVVRGYLIGSGWKDYQETGMVCGIPLPEGLQQAQKLAHVVPNHLTGIDPATVVDPGERDQIAGRSMVVRRLKPLMVEAVVRGYLIGSGWKDYQDTGAVCGIRLPPGLLQAQKLPQPIFTPASKAPAGEHDENISFTQVEKLVGKALAARVRDVSLQLYVQAAEYAAQRGIIIADTKFEFGTDASGELVLIDEALTPDSSRFWPAAEYRISISPPSFDKQFVRDWLETQPWNKRAPAPALPPDVLAGTAEKYREALRLLKA